MRAVSSHDESARRLAAAANELPRNNETYKSENDRLKLQIKAAYRTIEDSEAKIAVLEAKIAERFGAEASAKAVARARKLNAKALDKLRRQKEAVAKWIGDA